MLAPDASKILIANRGEIAARIIRTCLDHNIPTVAVYADQDRESPAVELATEAYALEGTTIQDTYLDADKILDIARAAGATHIHPGYGFLSEIDTFADQITEAGITWIGPSGDTIRQLGDKISARRTATKAGVSPVPGTNDPVSGMAEINAFIDEHQLPIVLKRADGGGGRGIYILRTDADVTAFEARHAASDADFEGFFIEKFVENGRHVETQCMRDSHGNFAVVTTRDCSVQRRNQKLIEEAPAPGLSNAVMARLEEWSRSLFDTTDYVGLGTCEFLVEGDNVYFLEVNPRLQVEHTVSEEITGLDMVAEQLRIANGEELMTVPELRGHSVELRITSEDPLDGLTPTSGTIRSLTWPLGHGVRIETSVREGDTVTADFDSMILKLIITASDRKTALARCRRALSEFRIDGIATPVPLLDAVLGHPDFTGETERGFAVGTTWLEKKYLPNTDMAELVADFATSNGVTLTNSSPETTETEGGELKDLVIELDGKRRHLRLPAGVFTGGGGSGAVQKPQQPRRGSRKRAAGVGPGDGQIGADGVLASPMQGIVVSIPVTPGQEVTEGDLLVVMEAMKMEKYVHASRAGVIEEILVDVAANIPAGTPMLKVGESENTAVATTETQEEA